MKRKSDGEEVLFPFVVLLMGFVHFQPESEEEGFLCWIIVCIMTKRSVRCMYDCPKFRTVPETFLLMLSDEELIYNYLLTGRWFPRNYFEGKKYN